MSDKGFGPGTIRLFISSRPSCVDLSGCAHAFWEGSRKGIETEIVIRSMGCRHISCYTKLCEECFFVGPDV